MRYAPIIVVVAAVCAVPAVLMHAVAKDAEGTAGQGPKAAGEEKPLLLSDDAPPLMLGDGEALEPAAGGADNSRCQVCHLNLAMEELAVTHAKKKIGCTDCHGNCDAHIDDESWASGGPGTPPEIMYWPERIDPACGGCHKTHDAPAKAVLRCWQQRFPEKTDVAGVVCTDCHGRHRLNPKLRKAWWDKRTGKPIRPAGQAPAVP